MLARGGGPWQRLPSVLSGAPTRSARSRRPSRSSSTGDRPPWSWWASRGSERRACSPSSRPAPTRSASSCSAVARPSSSATCPSGSSWTPSTSTSRGSTRDALRRSTRASGPSSRRSSRRCPAFASERQAALQHERYRSHRAVRELLELLASAQPLVLVLDDLHWADAASLELLGALLQRPAGHRRADGARGASPPGAGTALDRPGASAPRRHPHPPRAGGPEPRARPTSSWARRSPTPTRRSLRGERRQPLLPRAARAHARSTGRDDGPAPGDPARGDEGPAERRGGAGGGARPALRGDAPGAGGGRGGR